MFYILWYNEIGDNMNNGIKVSIDNHEIVIKGNCDDLSELASYINKVANSKSKIDHLHLDELTIINKDSPITNLIIEKE